jgi:hypothetical protein
MIRDSEQISKSHFDKRVSTLTIERLSTGWCDATNYCTARKRFLSDSHTNKQQDQNGNNQRQALCSPHANAKGKIGKMSTVEFQRAVLNRAKNFFSSTLRRFSSAKRR